MKLKLEKLKKTGIPISIAFMALGVFTNCESEEITETNNNEQEISVSKESSFSKIAEANYGNIRFDTKDQALETRADIEAILGTKAYNWEKTPGLVSIQEYSPGKGRLAIKIPEEVGEGVKAAVDIEDWSGYQIYYDVRFQSGFDFSKGGKLGFGFRIGRGVTGGKCLDAVENNRGGSFRLMWRGDGDEDAPNYLFPYIYHKNMLCDPDRNKVFGGELINTNRYPIEANKAYRIRLTIKTNSHKNAADGLGRMEVSEDYGRNYTTVWESNSMRWSGNKSTAERKIRQLYFSCFRGGSSSQWSGSKGDQTIYFDNLKWYRQ